MKLKLVEENRKYVTEDGALMVIKESGQIGTFNLKNAWVLRDWKGYRIDHSNNLEELVKKHGLELE